MLVLSSTDLTSDTRVKLANTYPTIKFEFYKDIEQAEHRLGEADILLTYGEDLTPIHIQKAGKLRWIMVLSAGMDLMPFTEIKGRNILVTNSKGIHKIPMAEYAIAMLLQQYHKTKKHLENQKNHYWDETIQVDEITGRTMVIVGTGEIGQEVARLAKAFQMTTIGISQSGRLKENFDHCLLVDDLDKALPKADFVVSILPSTKETKRFFTPTHFQNMPTHAIFLNMGRGDVVSSETLLEALDKKKIAHAILDVFEEEPLPKDHPFWDHEKVTLTPHTSSHSPQYIPRAIAIFEHNLKIFLNGKEDYQNQIDPDRGY